MYEDMVIDEAEVRVVLPEGATGVTHSLPLPADASHEVCVDSVFYEDISGYICSRGKKKKNEDS